MEVTVRLFAQLRERHGSDSMALELPEDATVDDALAAVDELAAGLPLVMAVNQAYADGSRRLQPGDELALVPPVSGGSGVVHARVTAKALSLDDITARVHDPRAGAIVTFQGVTRRVDHLDYEAYAEMAEARIQEIAAQSLERHGLCAAAVEHRTGEVELSEPSVIVAASSPHREAAFAGAREIIDRVKAEAPIWKKEEGDWVEGTQPPVA